MLKKGGERQVAYEKKAGVFCLLNTENQRRYIDASRSIGFAKKRLFTRLAEGSHRNARLQTAWQGGSGFSFEVLELLAGEDSERHSGLLAERRDYWIEHFRSDNVWHGYNLGRLKRRWEERRKGSEEEALGSGKINIRKLFQSVTSRLNPEIAAAEDRLRHLNALLNEVDDRSLAAYFSSERHIESQLKGKNDRLCEDDYTLIGLSRMADYLLFPKQPDRRPEREYEIRKTGSNANANYGGKKEWLAGGGADIEALSRTSGGKMPGDCSWAGRQNPFGGEAAQQAGEADLANHRFLKNIDDELRRLSGLLGFGLAAEQRKERQQGIVELYGRSGLYRLKKMYGELKRDSAIVKEQLCGTISFKRIARSAAKIDYDADTGYFTDLTDGDYVLVSENKLDFSNEKHIFHLLCYYGELQKVFHDKVNTDMYHLLHGFDELIGRTSFEPYMKRLIAMKRDGYDGGEIAEALRRTYGVGLDESKISRLFNRTIPKMIAETYRRSREEWLYTFKVKGSYKTCSKCRRNKLANENHFGRKADSKDGLHTICRMCR